MCDSIFRKGLSSNDGERNLFLRARTDIVEWHTAFWFGCFGHQGALVLHRLSLSYLVKIWWDLSLVCARAVSHVWVFHLAHCWSRVRCSQRLVVTSLRHRLFFNIESWRPILKCGTRLRRCYSNVLVVQVRIHENPTRFVHRLAERCVELRHLARQEFRTAAFKQTRTASYVRYVAWHAILGHVDQLIVFVTDDLLEGGYLRLQRPYVIVKWFLIVPGFSQFWFLFLYGLSQLLYLLSIFLTFLPLNPNMLPKFRNMLGHLLLVRASSVDLYLEGPNVLILFTKCLVQEMNILLEMAILLKKRVDHLAQFLFVCLVLSDWFLLLVALIYHLLQLVNPIVLHLQLLVHPLLHLSYLFFHLRLLVPNWCHLHLVCLQLCMQHTILIDQDGVFSL